jgi:purine-nucleoside phosphorylase
VSGTTRDVVRAAVAAFVAAFRQAKAPKPAVGLVLGSGLRSLAERIDVAARVDLAKIPGFPEPSVPGHSGTVVAGSLAGVPVAACVGRIHAYEGHPLPVVGLPARFLCAIGARVLVLTNAAGTLHADWRPGDAMLIRDHLNFLGGSPLEGFVDEDFGSRFADMSTAWPAELRVLALRAAPRGLTVREGVYAACRGPQYETPAEVRMLRALGADGVGMSTVPEAIVAAQMGVPALGISLVTNHAAGIAQAPLSHAEVLEVGKRSAGRLADWIERLVPVLGGAKPGKAPGRRPARASPRRKRKP